MACDGQSWSSRHPCCLQRSILPDLPMTPRKCHPSTATSTSQVLSQPSSQHRLADANAKSCRFLSFTSFRGQSFPPLHLEPIEKNTRALNDVANQRMIARNGATPLLFQCTEKHPCLPRHSLDRPLDHSIAPARSNWSVLVPLKEEQRQVQQA